jgi:hypothetical protein
MDKHIGTLELVFHWTAFGQDNSQQMLIVATAYCSHCSQWACCNFYWHFSPLFYRKLLQLLFLALAIGYGCGSDLDSSLATPEQSSAFSWTIPGCFWCVFGVVVLLDDQQPLTSQFINTFFFDTQFKNNNIGLHITLIIDWFHKVLHTFRTRGSKATPQ